MTLIFCSIFALSALAFSACDSGSAPPKDNTPQQGEDSPEEQGLSVKIGTYDAEKGTITLSAPANGKDYEAKESVTVTAEAKEGFDVAAILVGDEVVSRLASSYTFFYAEPVTVGAVFAPSAKDAPDVTFSSSVKSFGRAFRGYWASETGEELFIGETKLVYKGTAIANVAAVGSENEQAYNFTAGGVNYSLSWARTDYSVGYVIDVLNVTDGTREDFFPDPLPKANLRIAEKYAGEWTAADGGNVLTLSIGESLVYQGDTVEKILDGGYFATTNDIFATPIGTNIYFFLHGGTMHILMWNGETECPSVDDDLFNGNGGGTSYTFPELLRGTWKTADGKTAVITEKSFTLNGKAVTASGSDSAFFFTEGGKTYEVNLYAGSDYILQISSEILGKDGLIAGYDREYYFMEGRPAVTPDASLEGTWTGTDGTEGSVTVSGGKIVWDGSELILIAAGEERADGFIYFVSAAGKVYELFVFNMAETDGEPPVWVMTLSGDDGVFSFGQTQA